MITEPPTNHSSPAVGTLHPTLLGVAVDICRMDNIVTTYSGAKVHLSREDVHVIPNIIETERNQHHAPRGGIDIYVRNVFGEFLRCEGVRIACFSRSQHTACKNHVSLVT